MASPPKVLLFVACDAAVADGETGKATIVGVMSRIRVPRFPARVAFAVCAKLTGLNGDYDFRVEVVNLDLQDVLGRVVLSEMSVADPLEVIVVTLPLDRVEFDRPGRYAVRLIYNGRLAEELTLRLDLLL
jgi:hypothetical protein